MPSLSELKHLYRSRDRVVHAMAGEGLLRAAAIINTATAREAQRRHKLEPVGSVLLARSLSAASLMASFLKGEERIIVDIKSDGFVRTVYAEALQNGEVRGYVQYASAINGYPHEPLGHGILQIRKILYNRSEPILGIVELQAGNITVDLAHYFWQSEQIPTTVRLDVTLDEGGIISCSAGIIIQTLPGTSIQQIKQIHSFLRDIDTLCHLVSAGYSAEEILRQTLPSDINIFSTTPVDFFCRCSKERFKEMLLSLGAEEICNLRDGGHNELVCQYCGERYYLTTQDFEDLLGQLRAANN